MRAARLTLTLGLTAILAAAAGSLTSAQVNATVVLKNGQRHSGSNLAYRVDNRQVVVRTSQAEEPRFPVDQVAYVDFGGTSEPPNLNLSGSLEAVVLRDGSILKGQILELGHTNKADLSSPFLVIIRTEGGEERRLQSNQVSRVYFSGGLPASSGGSNVTAPDGQGFSVSAQDRWTSTGLTVRRGEPLTINASGEIRFGGGENMKATPSGSSDSNRENPLPDVPTGTLIGRVGNGQPFVIGNQKSVQAPAAGQLFLGINDSNLSDNQGSYQVEVRRVARSR
jgi:hypothetical protein